VTRVAIIQGHPDPAATHFGHALAAAYDKAALAAGHEVKQIQVAALEFPLLRTEQDWHSAPPPASIAEAQRVIAWAGHLLIVFPLWMGDMPAVLKGFFEQVLRPGFALGESKPGRLPAKLLKGRSARVMVTMGMPAFFYRLYYRGHSVKSLRRNMLGLCGIAPVRTSMVGLVGVAGSREKWLAQAAALGRRAA